MLYNLSLFLIKNQNSTPDLITFKKGIDEADKTKDFQKMV